MGLFSNLFGGQKPEDEAFERNYEDILDGMSRRSQLRKDGASGSAVPVHTWTQPDEMAILAYPITIARGTAEGRLLDLYLQGARRDQLHTVDGGFAYITDAPQAVWIDYQDAKVDPNDPGHIRMRMDFPIYSRRVPDGTILISAWIEKVTFTDGIIWANRFAELEADRCRDGNMRTWRQLGLK